MSYKFYDADEQLKGCYASLFGANSQPKTHGMDDVHYTVMYIIISRTLPLLLRQI